MQKHDFESKKEKHLIFEAEEIEEMQRIITKFVLYFSSDLNTISS